MLFEKMDFSFEILTILELTWQKRYASSGIRSYHALSFRIQGNSTFLYNTKKIEAKTGEVIFVPAYCEYTQIAENEKVIVVHFSSNFDFSTEITKFHTDNPQYFERKFKELYLVWTEKNIGYECECKSILYKILMHIQKEAAKITILDNHDKIMESIEYIHEHFTENQLSVDCISKRFGMSDTYFRKLFTQVTNKTPISYIQDLRFNYAMELLQSGYYTIQEISEKCGFSTIHYFSLFIKKRTSYPPSHFLPK